MGKLVRDRVVDIISHKGEIPHWHKIKDDGEFLEKLLDKLFEETHEVIGAKTPNERMLECVDVAEVLFAIIRLQKVTLRQFLRVLITERLKRGSFKKRIFLESVETSTTRPGRDGYHVFPRGHA